MHDLNFEHFPKDLPWLVRWYYRYFFPRFAKKATRIATVSEFSKSDIITQYDVSTDKIDVIYNNIVLSFESLYGKYYYIDEISNIENIKVFLDNVLYSEHNLSSDLDYLTEYTSFTKFN